MAVIFPQNIADIKLYFIYIYNQSLRMEMSSIFNKKKKKMTRMIKWRICNSIPVSVALTGSDLLELNIRSGFAVQCRTGLVI